tara:strand:+ start:923 stop:1600 length:678 start_codon:yes stop_codon:yes gene_type:complete
MKLSEHTTSVLKNFASINQNLVIKEGKTISTMSAMKNIVAKAEVDEDFPKEIAIYDLNEFLAALSLFTNPVLDFSENYVMITEEGKTGNSLKYFYSDPSVVTTPSSEITMPETEVKFSLDSSDLSKVQRAASVIGSPDLVLEKNGTGSYLTVKDKKNDTANNYSLDVDAEGNGEYNFFFKVDNLKLLPTNYDVNVSSKNISYFKSQAGNAVEYWIALEPESSYSE